MHHSRLCAVLVDCNTSDVNEAARFWGEALGRPVDAEHPGSRGNYLMLETPLDEPTSTSRPTTFQPNWRDWRSWARRWSIDSRAGS